MRAAFCSIIIAAFAAVFPVRADLTIVYSTAVEPVKQAQKPQQTPGALAAATNMMIRVKGDKARIDASPLVTAIFDGTTGELVNVLNDQKTVVRASPDKMKAIADMLNKSSNSKSASARPKLVPTGQREMISGYDTQQYTYDGPDFKAMYWIAPNYPNGAAILAQLQSIKSELWDAANTKMPDFRDFPGLPLRMRVIVGKENHDLIHKDAHLEHPAEIISTVTAVSLDSIPDTQFTVPADFKEANLPNTLQTASPAVSPNP